jgi:hypothetical protein
VEILLDEFGWADPEMARAILSQAEGDLATARAHLAEMMGT